MSVSTSLVLGAEERDHEPFCRVAGRQAMAA